MLRKADVCATYVAPDRAIAREGAPPDGGQQGSGAGRGQGQRVIALDVVRL